MGKYVIGIILLTIIMRYNKFYIETGISSISEWIKAEMEKSSKK